MTDGEYEVHEITVAPRPVAGVRAQLSRGRVSQEFRQHLDKVYAAGRAGDAALDGQNVFIYRPGPAEQLTVDFCVGVKAPFTGSGAVQPLETPSGIAVTTIHRGDYSALGNANAAIIEWCKAHNRALAGPSWEVYGHWTDDPTQLSTSVYYLLRANDDDASA